RETNLYSQCYIINRGEYFDRSKHNHSIVKIKELLAQEGYHNNVVTTAFYYDKKTKEVIPHIYITKGKRFAFGKIIVEISGDDESSSYHLLKSQIVRRLSRTLLSQKYKKSLINHESMLLKKYLGRKGFLQIGLELEEIKNFSTCVIDLKLKINVHQKRSFIFFGNRYFSKKELFEKILDFGQSAWLLPASLLAEEIISAYKQKGFWDATVVAQEE